MLYPKIKNLQPKLQMYIKKKCVTNKLDAKFSLNFAIKYSICLAYEIKHRFSDKFKKEKTG